MSGTSLTQTNEPILRYTGATFAASPLESLTNEEREMLSSFRKSIPTLFPDAQDSLLESFISDDITLYRYLKGEKWNLEKAQTSLQNTVAWRQEYGVNRLEPFDFRQWTVGTNYFNGFDRQGRPLVYLKKKPAGKGRETSHKKGIQLLVYTLETAIAAMPPGVHQIVLIMDFTLYNEAQSTPMSVAIETIKILTAHYPERLARAYIVNAPIGMRLFLNLVWPFLDDRTRNKVRMVTTGKGELLDWIDEDSLEVAYDGKLDFVFDHDVYWSKVKEERLV